MANLAHGESYQVTGSSGTPYTLHNSGGAYSCTCPAWLNQHAPPHQRTCKHLQTFRGADQEAIRLGQATPPTPSTGPTSTIKEVPKLLLAHSWDNATDLTGWWVSEKLDGVRAYWDGSHFISRQGNAFAAPDWFKAGLPSTPLDGELWVGRKEFQRTISIVKRQDFNDEWGNVRYMVFDAPEHGGEFEDRVAYLEEYFRERGPDYALLHLQERCPSIVDLVAQLDRVEALGGEGLMVREPRSKYVAGRSHSLLKVKRFHDAEARVIQQLPGTGKHMNRLGALLVELADGTQFSVGTGFSDAEREDPPTVGTLITFRYQELSNGGVPRFPSFVRVRTDDTELRMPEVLGRVSEGSPPPTGFQPVSRRVVVPVEPEPIMGAIRLEHGVGSVVRFWEVEAEGELLRVRYGRVGQPVHGEEVRYGDARSALKEAYRLIEQKIEKGYVKK